MRISPDKAGIRSGPGPRRITEVPKLPRYGQNKPSSRSHDWYSSSCPHPTPLSEPFAISTCPCVPSNAAHGAAPSHTIDRPPPHCHIRAQVSGWESSDSGFGTQSLVRSVEGPWGTGHSSQKRCLLSQRQTSALMRRGARGAVCSIGSSGVSVTMGAIDSRRECCRGVDYPGGRAFWAKRGRRGRGHTKQEEGTRE